MCRKKSSYYVTIVVYRFLTPILALSLSLSQPAQSSVRCEQLFNTGLVGAITQQIIRLNPARLFSKKTILNLTQQQVIELDEFLQSDSFKRPYGMAPGTREPMFMFFWNSLPPGKRDILSFVFESLTNSPKKFRMEFSDLLAANGLPKQKYSSMMEVLINNWHEHLSFAEKPLSFNNWIESLNEIYQQRIRTAEINPSDLARKFELGGKQKNASDLWTTTHGVNMLPTKIEGGKHWVKVNETWLKCIINESDKSMRVLVPREMIRRAAWNPIYSEVLQKKISDGTKPLAHYPAFIAGNGVFYLSDGNHRFILDSRKEVWLELSYPAKTSPFSISLDAIGIAQPTIDKLLQFKNREIDLPGLIGEANAGLFIYF